LKRWKKTIFSDTESLGAKPQNNARVVRVYGFYHNNGQGFRLWQLDRWIADSMGYLMLGRFLSQKRTLRSKNIKTVKYGIIARKKLRPRRKIQTKRRFTAYLFQK
jgi:hypothetical protein